MEKLDHWYEDENALIFLEWPEKAEGLPIPMLDWKSRQKSTTLKKSEICQSTLKAGTAR